MYTFHDNGSEFRIVRRARRWFVEGSGDTIGTFATAEDAARALAECELLWPNAAGVPADLSKWRRGPVPAGEADPLA